MIVDDLELKKCINIKNKKDVKNYIREKLQILIISGLSDTDFYKNFAFTGGTCLRLMYNTDRYSEDLDFDFVKKEYKGYDFNKCFNTILDYLDFFNVDCDIEYKEKNNEISIKTFNLKFDFKNLLNVFDLKDFLNEFQEGQLLKIKFEVETDFNESEKFEIVNGDMPLYEINTVSKESMMANKLNAILRRNENTNIKGRDFFDLKYYIDNNVKLNIELFNYCFKRDGITLNGIEKHIDPPKNKEELIKLIKKKIKNIDFELVKKDIFSFVNNDYDLSIYNLEYFSQLVEKINVDYTESKEDYTQ